MVLPFALGATDKGEYGGDIHPFSTYFYGLQRITGVLAVGLTLSLGSSPVPILARLRLGLNVEDLAEVYPVERPRLRLVT